MKQLVKKVLPRAGYQVSNLQIRHRDTFEDKNFADVYACACDGPCFTELGREAEEFLATLHPRPLMRSVDQKVRDWAKPRA